MKRSELEMSDKRLSRKKKEREKLLSKLQRLEQRIREEESKLNQ